MVKRLLSVLCILAITSFGGDNGLFGADKNEEIC